MIGKSYLQIKSNRNHKKNLNQKKFEHYIKTQIKSMIEGEINKMRKNLILKLFCITKNYKQYI